MRWHLVVAEGRNEGKTIPMREGELLIGRDEKCRLRAKSQEISRRHCVLLLKGGSLRLRDLKSMNGTFVNERAIQGEVELQDLDRLRVGPLRLIVRKEAVASNAAGLEPSDEAIAAMMLEMEQDTPTVDDAEAAARTTTFADIPLPREEPAQPSLDPTATMAKSILDKYRKRAGK